MVAARSTFLVCLLLGLAIGWSVAGPAEAHGGLAPWIDVPQTQVEPGGRLVVLGDDLEPADVVRLELASGATVHMLGTVTTDHRGHFRAELEVPAEADEGEAYVQVATGSGWVASLWIHVGASPTTDLGSAAPSAGAPLAAPLWLDPALLLLALFVATMGAAFLSALWRSRMGPPQGRLRRS